MRYTYPQVQELLAQCNKYIQFEVEIMTAPMRAIFGSKSGAVATESSDTDSADYADATEDDINALARILGGG